MSGCGFREEDQLFSQQVRCIVLFQPTVHSSLLFDLIQTALLNCIRAIGGYTLEGDAQFAFDTDTFKEHTFLANLKARGADVPAAMNWYE